MLTHDRWQMEIREKDAEIETLKAEVNSVTKLLTEAEAEVDRLRAALVKIRAFAILYDD